MRIANRTIGLLVLAIVLLLGMAGCSRVPQGGPTATPTTVEPTQALAPTPTDTLPAPSSPTPQVTPTPTPVPVTQADLDAGLEVVRQFLTGLSIGDFRQVYASLLTTGGQQRLADLVLGRLALTNPRISYFELLGAEPAAERVAVDVAWEESYEGQGVVGRQVARVLLARQGEGFLVDDVALAEYVPAATPPPPALPRAEALTNPAVPGQDMQFRASGFASGETVLAWLELPDGSLTAPSFQSADATGTFELAYSGATTRNLQPGRWIWWAQALRDSTRNTGITFDVLPVPSPTAPPAPTRPAQPRLTTAPTPRPAQPAPTPTPRPPSTAYGAPVLLWPDAVGTAREYPGALVVEFVPVAEQLAENEFYELVLVARDTVGNVYNAGSVRGKGDACSGQYSQPCRSLVGDLRFMELFYPSGFEGQGVWYVQVVRQTGPDQFTPVSPPSEQRAVTLKPR